MSPAGGCAATSELVPNLWCGEMELGHCDAIRDGRLERVDGEALASTAIKQAVSYLAVSETKVPNQNLVRPASSA